MHRTDDAISAAWTAFARGAGGFFRQNKLRARVSKYSAKQTTCGAFGQSSDTTLAH